MKYSIEGGNIPVLRVNMTQGESILADNGDMVWMTRGIKMETSTNGGFFKGIARSFSGESMFINKFTALESGTEVAFSPPSVGAIKVVEIEPGRGVICQKGAFMASDVTVECKLAFQKRLGSIFFGGEGFVLQKLSGSGTAFLEIDGALIEKELAHGEELLVNPGYVAYFDESVSYEIEMVKGVKNILFGGEGLFLVRLRGAGRVGLQTLPLAALAGAINEHLPKQQVQTQSSNNNGASINIGGLFGRK